MILFTCFCKLLYLSDMLLMAFNLPVADTCFVGKCSIQLSYGRTIRLALWDTEVTGRRVALKPSGIKITANSILHRGCKSVNPGPVDQIRFGRSGGARTAAFLFCHHGIVYDEPSTG